MGLLVPHSKHRDSNMVQEVTKEVWTKKQCLWMHKHYLPADRCGEEIAA